VSQIRLAHALTNRDCGVLSNTLSHYSRPHAQKRLAVLYALRLRTLHLRVRPSVLTSRHKTRCNRLVPLHILQPLQEIRIIGRRKVQAHLIESWLVATRHHRRRWLRAQDLIQYPLQCSSTLVADMVVAFAGGDHSESGDEYGEVLDRFGAGEDFGGVLSGLLLLEQFDGEDASGG
jgi:hypothetical protein